MAVIQRYTWDGVPVAQDQPHGAAVIVRRPAAGADGYEYLILHRAHHGPDYDGDWAWTPPSGSRQPGEPVVGAAVRELAEETGLTAAPADLRAIDLSGAWAQFRLDVPPGHAARLDAEHDRFQWLPAAEAIARCQPAAVADALASPDIANHASIRALEKAGFGQAGEITVPGEPGPEQLCVLDLVRFFGERAAPELVASR